MTRLALALASTMLASACSTVGNLTSIYRTPDLDRGDSVVLDAEQWAILNIPREEEHRSSENPRQSHGQSHRNVVCAMPSPDAIAAAAAAGNLSLENPGGTSGAASLGIGEAASSIGLRTQSIQLLRDAMYRMCEGYAAGAIDEIQYGVMMRRFQGNMIAILAIEQLTGAAVAPPVAVSATAETSIFQQLIGERNAIDRDLRNINVPGADPEGASDEQKAENKRLREERARLEQDRNRYETALTALARGDFTAANVSLGAVSMRPAMRDERALAAVAQSVEAITLAAMNSDLRPDMCFEETRRRQRETSATPSAQMATSTRANTQEDKLGHLCAQYADSGADREFVTVQIIESVAAALIKGGLDTQEFDMLRVLIAQIDSNWSSGDLRDFPGGDGDNPAQRQPNP